MTEYKLGDYVRIHNHDGAEITVKISDSGVPSRYSDFAFKAGARMFKNSEILGLGEVPVVSEKKFEEEECLFKIGDQVIIDRTSRAVIVGRDYRSAIFPYRVQYFGGHKDWIEVHRIKHFIPELPTPAPDTEVHADLVAENEAVKHPAHYGGADDPYEAIKVIEAWDLNFNLGSVLKYVRRAGKKDASKELEDLRKARFYIDHEISRMEQS